MQISKGKLACICFHRASEKEQILCSWFVKPQIESHSHSELSSGSGCISSLILSGFSLDFEANCFMLFILNSIVFLLARDVLPKNKWKPPQKVPKEPNNQLGVNQKAYYVCHEPGLKWMRLPSVTPQQIVAARTVSS